MIFASVNNLVKNYGNHCAVDNLSFNVSEGEIFGLIGPNGLRYKLKKLSSTSLR